MRWLLGFGLPERTSGGVRGGSGGGPGGPSGGPRRSTIHHLILAWRELFEVNFSTKTHLILTFWGSGGDPEGVPGVPQGVPGGAPFPI